MRKWRVLFSRKEAVLEQLRAIQIHGAPFYDIVFTSIEAPDSGPQAVRIGSEMIYAKARVGDRVMIEQIANIVTRVEKL